MRNPDVRSRLAVLVPGTVLGVAVFANFSQFGARVVLSAVLPSIIDDYSVSRNRIGLVLTLMGAVFALFQLLSGLLGDPIDCSSCWASSS
jgi:MFS family permease